MTTNTNYIMRDNILGRVVEGDEDGVRYLDELDEAAEEIFKEAKHHHSAKFHDHHGRKFILTHPSPGHYVVAQSDGGSSW